MVIKRGDCSLKLGASHKIEHYFSNNIALLNNNLPDQAEYFKHYVDLIFDFAYGEEKFGHKAVQAFTKLRHKGVWGRGSVFADSDSSLPTNLKLDRKDTDAVFGDHRHQNGKPLVWISEAWLHLSLNAIIDNDSECRHFLKLGWFPFDLDPRGIAQGSVYGLNREFIGLYSYPEDKSAPGILLHGEFFKDKLWYDIYYSKFEERGKSLRDTLNQVKEQHVGRKANPYRGVAKDDELIGAHLKWRAFDNDCGKLELDPYVFYNEASDQKVEIPADTKTEFGAFGLAVEYKYNSFEYGADVAFNFGTELLYNIDRNRVKIKRDATGSLTEIYSHIVDGSGNRAPVTELSTEAAQVDARNANEPLLNGFRSKSDRFRKELKNKLRGWMAVVDGSYTFEDCDLSVAAAFGYASGDTNPHAESDNDCETRTFNGFIGLHELYTGKRVNSVILLDERLTKIPSPFQSAADANKANQDLAFSDLIHVGMSATWTPRFNGKKFTVNPNVMFFWRDQAVKKLKFVGDELTVLDEDASRFMGTEFNVQAKVELLPGLTMYGTLAFFGPGNYFKDISGLPLDDDFFESVKRRGAETDLRKQEYGLGHDNVVYTNVGFQYKF